MMAAEGVETLGVDPVAALLDRARALHPEGDYRPGRGEALPVEDGAFDLVVAYLTLIDMPDIGRAIPEMVRALAPGGRSARWPTSKATRRLARSSERPEGAGCVVDRYMEERATRVAWDGIQVENWHRAALDLHAPASRRGGFGSSASRSPLPREDLPPGPTRSLRAPWLLMMEWSKP